MPTGCWSDGQIYEVKARWNAARGYGGTVQEIFGKQTWIWVCFYFSLAVRCFLRFNVLSMFLIAKFWLLIVLGILFLVLYMYHSS